MIKMNKLKMSLLVLPILTSCSLDHLSSLDMKKIEKKATLINHYEQVSLRLARDNRGLRAEVKRLEFELEKMKQDRTYSEFRGFTRKLEEHDESTVAQYDNAHSDPHADKVSSSHETHGRAIASMGPASTTADGKKDYVEFKIYKWHAEDLLKIADKEFAAKHYEKAAQFYTSLVNNYSTNKNISDEFYFKAGIASFESGNHHEWTIDHFQALMHKYPTSKYFRSAKLWVGLTHMKMGDKKKFYDVVEEFRKKYRNTNEWKILSSYYEQIEEKTNE